MLLQGGSPAIADRRNRRRHHLFRVRSGSAVDKPFVLNDVKQMNGNTTPPRRRQGRPALPPDEQKSAFVGFRCEPTLRVALQDSARNHDRTLSQDILRRVVLSFYLEPVERAGSELAAILAAARLGDVPPTQAAGASLQEILAAATLAAARLGDVPPTQAAGASLQEILAATRLGDGGPTRVAPASPSKDPGQPTQASAGAAGKSAAEGPPNLGFGSLAAVAAAADLSGELKPGELFDKMSPELFGKSIEAAAFVLRAAAADIRETVAVAVRETVPTVVREELAAILRQPEGSAGSSRNPAGGGDSSPA
jgi:hypothetical protein